MKKKLLIVLPFVVVALFVMGLVMLLGTNSNGVNTTVVHADAPTATETNYMYLKNTGDNTAKIKIKKNINSVDSDRLPTIYYSIGNKSSWNLLAYDTDYQVTTGEKIYFAGEYKSDLTADDYAFGASSKGVTFILGGSTLSLGGDITTLLTYAGNVTDLSNYGKGVFYNLFYNNVNICLTAFASDFVMPSTTLTEQCYFQMFRHTGLVEAPADLLPATEMKISCYDKMFYDCANLTKAPDLPAPVLVKTCYRQMFFKCLNLESLRVNFKTWRPTGISDGAYQMLPGLEKGQELTMSSFEFTCPASLDLTFDPTLNKGIDEILSEKLLAKLNVHLLTEDRKLTTAPTLDTLGKYNVDKYVDGEKIDSFCATDVEVSFADWYLSTSMQIKKDGEKYLIRFIGMLDENIKSYAEAGFTVKVNGGEAQKITTIKGFETFLANGTTITINDAGMDSGYFFIGEMTSSVASNVIIEVTPYVTVISGNKTVEGSTAKIDLGKFIEG